MTRFLAAAALGALVACSGDGRVVAPPSPARNAVDGRPSLALSDPAVCTVTPQQLLTLSDAAFAESPSASSVKGKLATLVTLVEAEIAKPTALRDFTAARAQAIVVLEFTTRKNSQRPLGPPSAVTAFVNAVSCYAGLGLTADETSVTVVLEPTDGPRTIYSANGYAAISLPAGAVPSQSLLTLREIDKNLYAVLGTGPLSTRYDQYPGFWDFDLTTPTGSTVIKRSTIAICSPENIDDVTNSFLRLGHQALAGFKFEPEPVAGDPPEPVLNCTGAYTLASAGDAFRIPELLGRVASLFTPRTAFAASNTMMLAGGGVGGTVTELSPFAPVDTRLSLAGGGVGGTVTELKILTDQNQCETPIGSAVESACRPKVFVRTPLGTPFENVSLRFTVDETVPSIGSIAPLSNAACGATFAKTTTILTGTDGSAAACWTLGPVPGLNQVIVEGLIGNNALPETRFTGRVRYKAVATPAAAFVFTTAPLAGSAVVAGTNIPVTLTIVDKNGERVYGFNGEVTLTLNKNGFAGATPSAIKAFASQGIVTFPPVAIQKAATGYRLSATADFNVPVTGVLTTTDGVLFDVVSAAGANLAFITTPPSVPAGTSVNATVRLTDAFGNPIALAPIDWAAGGSTGAAVSPAQSLTDADGRASTTWTLGPLGNELTATFGALPSISLSGTGTVASTIQTVNQCAAGTGPGDPFAGGSKAFAFYIPGASGNQTLKTITLFISSAGSVSQTATTYNLQLAIQKGSFSTAVATPVFATAAVQLRGNNSERKAVTFVLPATLGATTARGNDLALTLSVPNGTGGRTLSFATGVCSPGGKCDVSLPRGCFATEIALPATPLPLGTPYRKSVGITVTAQ